jgi:hypothetical protein
MEGMDRVLNVQHLSVLDLIDPVEVNKRASILPPSRRPAYRSHQPLILSMHVKEILKFGDRKGWERFVIIKADAQGE